jgi:hypothetical protein
VTVVSLYIEHVGSLGTHYSHRSSSDRDVMTPPKPALLSSTFKSLDLGLHTRLGLFHDTPSDGRVRLVAAYVNLHGSRRPSNPKSDRLAVAWGLREPRLRGAR